MATTGLRPVGTQRPTGTVGWRSINGAPEDRIANAPTPPSGVPRIAPWVRHRRLSTWHRPFVAALVALDLVAVLMASVVVVTTVHQAVTNTFSDSLGLFYAAAYVLLPVVWLVALWGHGAYDRRHLGMGTDEFKRVARAPVTVMATVSFLAFTPHLRWTSNA
jgi:hypothetical protein